MHKYAVAGVFGLLLTGWFPLLGQAHEPLFGVGPHTIYEKGLGLETELEVEDEGITLHNEVIYGVTPDLAVTLVAPWVRKEEGGRTDSGLGDLTLPGKCRFFSPLLFPS